jgi:imidazolonepropionase-like amidohydrolase
MPRCKAALGSAFAVLLSLNAPLLRSEVIVLKNFTLIDGRGGAPVSGAAMIVDSGRITWIGPVAQLKPPASARVTDLSGKYIMPGIIDLHVHLGATVDLDQRADLLTQASTEHDLQTYASYGVTTVLSMGTDKDLVIEMRDRQRAGLPTEARIFTAGEGFVFKGAYGGLAGVNRGVSNAADVKTAIDALASKRVDIVKLWMDDHLGELKKMPWDIGKAIIDDAHKRNLRVSAHVFYLADAKALASYGVNGFAHMVRDKPVDAELIDSMKKHGTWQQAATLSREASMFVYAKTPPFLNDPFFTRGVSANVVNTLKSPAYQAKMAADPHFSHYKEFLETAEKNFKRLADAGVPYGFGTDAGPPGRFPGYMEHWELELLVEAGLTPSQAITASTKSSAEYLKAADLGTLEKSKWADLIVLDKNPLADIKNSRTIHSVYIAGNQVKR